MLFLIVICVLVSKLSRVRVTSSDSSGKIKVKTYVSKPASSCTLTSCKTLPTARITKKLDYPNLGDTRWWVERGEKNIDANWSPQYLLCFFRLFLRNEAEHLCQSEDRCFRVECKHKSNLLLNAKIFMITKDIAYNGTTYASMCIMFLRWTAFSHKSVPSCQRWALSLNMYMETGHCCYANMATHLFPSIVLRGSTCAKMIYSIMCNKLTALEKKHVSLFEGPPKSAWGSYFNEIFHNSQWI